MTSGRFPVVLNDFLLQVSRDMGGNLCSEKVTWTFTQQGLGNYLAENIEDFLKEYMCIFSSPEHKFKTGM